MSAEYDVWFKEYAELTAILAPAVIEIDGDKFIDVEHAPPAVLRTYQSMRQLGYAKGWL